MQLTTFPSVKSLPVSAAAGHKGISYAACASALPEGHSGTLTGGKMCSDAIIGKA